MNTLSCNASAIIGIWQINQLTNFLSGQFEKVQKRKIFLYWAVTECERRSESWKQTSCVPAALVLLFSLRLRSHKLCSYTTEDCCNYSFPLAPLANLIKFIINPQHNGFVLYWYGNLSLHSSPQSSWQVWAGPISGNLIPFSHHTSHFLPFLQPLSSPNHHQIKC